MNVGVKVWVMGWRRWHGMRVREGLGSAMLSIWLRDVLCSWSIRHHTNAGITQYTCENGLWLTAWVNYRLTQPESRHWFYCFDSRHEAGQRWGPSPEGCWAIRTRIEGSNRASSSWARSARAPRTLSHTDTLSHILFPAHITISKMTLCPLLSRTHFAFHLSGHVSHCGVLAALVTMCVCHIYIYIYICLAGADIRVCRITCNLHAVALHEVGLSVPCNFFDSICAPVLFLGPLCWIVSQ